MTCGRGDARGLGECTGVYQLSDFVTAKRARRAVSGSEVRTSLGLRSRRAAQLAEGVRAGDATDLPEFVVRGRAGSSSRPHNRALAQCSAPARSSPAGSSDPGRSTARAHQNSQGSRVLLPVSRRSGTTLPAYLGPPPLADRLSNSVLWGNGQGQNRTADTVIFSHVLYQLSYLAGRTGKLLCELESHNPGHDQQH